MRKRVSLKIGEFLLTFIPNQPCSQMKLFSFVLISFLFFPLQIFAQENEAFFSELSEGLKLGNSELLAQLLDDEVNITNNGKEQFYSRDEAMAELLRFFQGNSPVGFKMKHRGASADGQLYMIGMLDTREGRNYKIVCRARSWDSSSGYRIFKLDMVGSN